MLHPKYLLIPTIWYTPQSFKRLSQLPIHGNYPMGFPKGILLRFTQWMGCWGLLGWRFFHRDFVAVIPSHSESFPAWNAPVRTSHSKPMTDPYVCHIWFAIYHQYTPVLLAYIPYMDPMGKTYPSHPNGPFRTTAGCAAWQKPLARHHCAHRLWEPGHNMERMR